MDKERLQKAIGDFVVRWVKTNTPHETVTELVVRVSVQTIPLTEEATQPRYPIKPTKRTAANRPLTEAEWDVLENIPYTRKWQKLFEFFKESDNEEATISTMVAAGVIETPNFGFGSFNNFLRKHGSNCVLKRSEISHVAEKESKFRLFPLESKTE